VTICASCCIVTFASVARVRNPLPMVEHARLITPWVVCAIPVRVSRLAGRAWWRCGGFHRAPRSCQGRPSPCRCHTHPVRRSVPDPPHPPQPGQPAAGVGQIGGPWARPGPGLGAIGQHSRQQLGQRIGRGRHRWGRGGGAAAGFAPGGQGRPRRPVSYPSRGMHRGDSGMNLWKVPGAVNRERSSVLSPPDPTDTGACRSDDPDSNREREPG